MRPLHRRCACARRITSIVIHTVGQSMLLLRNLVISDRQGQSSKRKSGYKAPAAGAPHIVLAASPLILCRLCCKMNRFALGWTGTRTVVGQADSELSHRSRVLQSLTDGDNPDKIALDAFDFLTSLGAPKGISPIRRRLAVVTYADQNAVSLWLTNTNADILAMQTLPLCGAATAATLEQRVLVQSIALTWASLQQRNLQLSTDSQSRHAQSACSSLKRGSSNLQSGGSMCSKLYSHKLLQTVQLKQVVQFSSLKAMTDKAMGMCLLQPIYLSIALLADLQLYLPPHAPTLSPNCSCSLRRRTQQHHLSHPVFTS